MATCTPLDDGTGFRDVHVDLEVGIPAMLLAVCTDGDPLALVPILREAVWSVNRNVPLSDTETMDAKIGRSLGEPRLLLSLLVAFAGLGPASVKGTLRRRLPPHEGGRRQVRFW